MHYYSRVEGVHAGLLMFSSPPVVSEEQSPRKVVVLLRLGWKILMYTWRGQWWLQGEFCCFVYWGTYLLDFAR